MPQQDDYPPIIAGFFEGLLAPVVELVVVVILTAGVTATQSIGSSSILISGLVGMIIFDFFRNIAIGLSHSQFAIGNVVGNVIGIWIFYAAIDSVSHEAATEALLLTIALVGSFVLGLVILVYSSFSSSSESSF